MDIFELTLVFLKNRSYRFML